jgi:hypothetical protein
MFMRMIKPGGSLPPATISYRTSNTNTANQTSYTFSGQDIGTAAADRRVVVMFTIWCQGTFTVTGVTIAGVAATWALPGNVDNGAGQGWFRTGYAVANIPSGTTGDIVITANGGCNHVSIGVWAVYGLLSSTPTATGADNAFGGDATLNINIAAQAGGAVIAHQHDVNNTATRTWSGLTENYDVTGTENNARSGASIVSQAGGTINIGCTRTPTTNGGVMAAIALR